MSSRNTEYILVGDINCRFGNLLDSLILPHGWERANSEDSKLQPNTNARNIFHVVRECGLIPVNNLTSVGKTFCGALTFRRKEHWISELDWCICTPKMLSCMSSLHINNDLCLPSNHAPLSIGLNLPVSLECVLERAKNLLGHAVEDTQTPQVSNVCRKPRKTITADKDRIFDFLDSLEPPNVVNDSGDVIEQFAVQFTDILYQSLMPSHETQGSPVDTEADRWSRLLNNNDHKDIWRAINWKGELATHTDHSNMRPKDIDFKLHFEHLLNPSNLEPLDPDLVTTNITVPVLDDPISVNEVIEAIKGLKSNKASGPDGVSPGVFKCMPDSWVNSLTILFNQVFEEGIYPKCWSLSKLSVLYKKGNAALCDNYRGISVMNSIAKLYDMILGKRLEIWFKPLREQAGAQKSRSCEEQISTLRLAIDIAKRRKEKLFIVYVDYTKAYDKIPRGKLLQILKRIGCGHKMLRALAKTYNLTESALGSIIINAIIGLKQGSPTSGLLFIIYLNELVKLYHARCQEDGFLRWLHCLLLMDDSVLLATSRERAIEKLKIMTEFCDQYGMEMNCSKTKFMVINGSECDRIDINIDGENISHCSKYTYLGAVIHEEISFKQFIDEHTEMKNKNLLKFYSFLNKNGDLPYKMKCRVLEACLLSSVVYSCESWFSDKLGKLNTLYLASIKAVLGVRETCPNMIALLEGGLPGFLR